MCRREFSSDDCNRGTAGKFERKSDGRDACALFVCVQPSGHHNHNKTVARPKPSDYKESGVKFVVLAHHIKEWDDANFTRLTIKRRAICEDDYACIR